MIVDWKTNAKIEESNRFQKMLGPCYSLDDCNLNHYSIQTSIYRAALAKTYNLGGFNKIQTYIVQLGLEDKSSEKNYKVWKTNPKIDERFIENVIEFGWKKNSLQN